MNSFTEREHYDLNDIINNRKMLIEALIKKFPEHGEEIKHLKTEVGARAVAIIKKESISIELADKIKKEFPLSIH